MFLLNISCQWKYFFNTKRMSSMQPYLRITKHKHYKQTQLNYMEKIGNEYILLRHRNVCTPRKYKLWLSMNVCGIHAQTYTAVIIVQNARSDRNK